LLKEYVETVRSTPNAYSILMGDTFDMARTHYRNYIRGYRDDENSQEALDNFARREVADLAKILEPIKHRIWAVIKGNHSWDFMDRTNSDQYLCQLLGLNYLGVMGLIRVTCEVYKQKGNAHPAVRNLVVYVHHSGGSMGGRTTGGSVNALTRQEVTFDADIYLIGHDHRRIAFKEPVLTASSRGARVRLLARDRVFARCGAFLKGFKEGPISNTVAHRPGYAAIKALRPTDLGWVEIKVKWRSSSQRNELENGRVRKTADAVYPEYKLIY
jgi:hypothetical protein